MTPNLTRTVGYSPAMSTRERAWNEVHDALPSGWHVGPPTYDPEGHCWAVTARSPKPGRRKPPETITRTGEERVIEEFLSD